jgi:hypothetical protein
MNDSLLSEKESNLDRTLSSSQSTTSPESQSNDSEMDPSHSAEPFIHPDELSQDDLIQEATSPKKRTLNQRSLTLQVVLNNRESIPQEKLKEVALQQLRGPLTDEGRDDSHFIFHHFFTAAGLYMENDTSHGQNIEEFSDAVLTQSSMVARKAMLVRYAEAAPDHIDEVINILHKKGLNVPSLDGSPTENLPQLEEIQ